MQDERLAGGSRYEEIDERISKDSLTYPETQAKLVNDWLNKNETNTSAQPDGFTTIRLTEQLTEHDSCGNVVGIRGFSSPIEQLKCESRLREFNKLKSEYLKLRSEHDRTKSSLEKLLARHRKALESKDNDISLLKASLLKNKQTFRHNRQKSIGSEINSNSIDFGDKHEDLIALQSKIDELNHKLAQVNEEHEHKIESIRIENERFLNETENSRKRLEAEINELNDKLNEKAITCRHQIGDGGRELIIDKHELERVEIEYKKLEDELRLLVESKKLSDEQKNAEISRVFVELCRLQVNQPKLESMLAKEREIKTCLRNQLDDSIEENDKLKKHLNQLEMKLRFTQIRCNNRQSNEMDKLTEEVARWQDSCFNLKKEKSDLEEVIRALKLRIRDIDSRSQSEMDAIRAEQDNEINRLKGELSRREIILERLKLKLDEQANRLAEMDDEKHSHLAELTELKRQVELSKCKLDAHQAILKKLQVTEELVSTLKQRLMLAQTKHDNLLQAQSESVYEVEKIKQHYDELKVKFQNQQQYLDELTGKNGKELAKLRTNLHYEQCNKQLALKTIERELRSSLRDIESVRQRFCSHQLSKSGSNAECVVITNSAKRTNSGIGAKSINQKTALLHPKACDKTRNSLSRPIKYSMKIDRLTSVERQKTISRSSSLKSLPMAASRIRVIPVRALVDNYMYLLIDEATRHAAAVDPVNPSAMANAVSDNSADLKAILTTHHHYDHAHGNTDMLTMFPELTVYGGDHRVQALTKHVNHGEIIKLGSLNVECLATPCHTKGHICYYVTCNENQSDGKTKTSNERVVFTGDTLFVAGCGRFFEGSSEQMNLNLNTILGNLPSDTKVYCGHEYTVTNLKFALSVEPQNQDVKNKLTWAQAKLAKKEPTIPSTIGEEKKINPFMRLDKSSVKRFTGETDELEVMTVLRQKKNEFQA